MAHLSIVSPVYKAEGCISELCRRLKLAIEPLTEDYEIILVEDRSPDNSWAVIQTEAKKDSRVKGIRLARNFGQHRAITAGLDITNGDWVVVMDCDLQDSPEHIPILYNKAKEGYEIVVAQFYERVESRFRQKVSKFFWSRVSWLAGIPFDHRVGNFRIMSKSVVENFRTYREQLRLLGGITSLMGFTSTSLSLKRDERFHGETSYSFRKLLSVAVEISIAYSDKPLKISIVVGLLIAAASISIGAAILFLGLSGIITVPGWASVMVSLYFIGGLIVANLGVIGFYIGKTYDETKRRPLYIVESTTDKKTPKISSLKGSVVWITGLSGAGKSSLANEVVARQIMDGKKPILLDGDLLREVFCVVAADNDNYGLKERLALAMQYSHLCQNLASQGQDVVISTISLFKEIHEWNRENLPNYFEVFLRVPLEELRRRDTKSIYQRFDAGEIKNVAGLDLLVDEPINADLVIDFVPERTVKMLASELLIKLKDKSFP